MKKQKEVTQEQTEYEKAIGTIKRLGPYILQKQDPDYGEWYNVGKSVRGLEAANKLLNEARERTPELRARVLPKLAADALREGMHLGLALAKREKREEQTKRYRPLMFMPENL